MDFLFSFKHMDTSDALQNYAEEKIKEIIGKFISKPTKTHVTFSVDRHNHLAHCAVSGGDGVNLQVEHTCTDMYASVDKMVDKLESQLKRHKEKLKEKKGDPSGYRVRDKKLSVAAGGRKKEVDIENEAIDAEDILKFETARRRLNSA